MKRDIYINRLKEFILHKPGRPFSEVETYGEEIGATYEELEAAISEIAQAKHMDTPIQNLEVKYTLAEDSSPPPPHHARSFLKNKHKSIIFGAITCIILIAFGLTFVPSFSKKEKGAKNTTVLSESVATPSSALIKIPPQIVYASKESIDPQKIFSAPVSDVTLRYTGTPKKEVFGFFPYWMLDVEDKVTINSYTSIALFGLETDATGKMYTVFNGEEEPGWKMWTDPRLSEFIARLKRKRIKVLLTIKAFNNENIEHLVASDDAQRTFIANTLELVKTKSLDGVNLDFEYVGVAPESTILGFVRLVANLNTELKRQLPRAILSVDTYLRAASNRDFADLGLLSEHVDSFVIMAYDVHTLSGEPGPITPLEGPDGLLGYLQSYLERIAPEKIILAVPYYAYDWVVSGAPTREQNQVYSYAEVAASSRVNTIQWNDTYQTPFYRYTGSDRRTHEVHFENTRSLGIKYDLVNQKNLRGIGVWAIGYDGLNQELTQLILEKFAQ